MDLDHIALYVQNPMAMVTFYTEVLPLASLRAQDYANGDAPFPSARINKTTILDFFPPEMHAPGYNGCAVPLPTSRSPHICLSLTATELYACVRRLEDAEVSILEGPVERWGARGIAMSIYIADPENNVVELRTYDPLP